MKAHSYVLSDAAVGDHGSRWHARLNVDRLCASLVPVPLHERICRYRRIDRSRVGTAGKAGWDSPWLQACDRGGALSVVCSALLDGVVVNGIFATFK